MRGGTEPLTRVENLEGEMIGRAGFGEVGGCRELAYTFRRDQWGQGFATEIAGALNPPAGYKRRTCSSKCWRALLYQKRINR